jgi:3-deoxy-D-manno-octulosonate 8-phosphate phosphatase (KDO 8-P phosphatase)
MSNFKEKLKEIRTLIFDIDGVLSRQTITIDQTGTPMRTVNLRDGYALQLAVKRGYRIAVISGAINEPFRERLNNLNISDVYLGVRHKLPVYREYLDKHGLTDDEVLYMGDDIPDYEVMSVAGVAACPGDADSEIKQISGYISDKNGGEGCVRDIIEQVMRLHGTWLNHDAFSW